MYIVKTCGYYLYVLNAKNTAEDIALELETELGVTGISEQVIKLVNEKGLVYAVYHKNADTKAKELCGIYAFEKNGEAYVEQNSTYLSKSYEESGKGRTNIEEVITTDLSNRLKAKEVYGVWWGPKKMYVETNKKGGAYQCVGALMGVAAV